jgi:hypothetical protein
MSNYDRFLTVFGTVVVNVDPNLAFSDGLKSGELERLEKALGDELSQRVVFVPELAIRCEPITLT